MRKKRAAEVGPDGVMPQELRRRPTGAEEVDYWLAGDRMPSSWDFGGEVWWRRITAQQRWSQARREWRTEHDRSSWWYWRSRDLPAPPRSQREAYRQEIN